MQGSKFQWVNTCEASIPQDDDIRTLIRKQAMKHVAKNRRSRKISSKRVIYRTATQKDESQCRIHEDNSSIPQESLLTPESEQSEISEEAQLEKSLEIITSPCGTGYQSLRSKYGIDITELSMLTTFHVGRATQGISKDLLEMSNILRSSIPSYLSQLPQLYGHTEFIDLAMECLLSRMQSIVLPISGSAATSVIPIYRQALQSLQEALNDPRLQLGSEVLCAVSLLSLFEILDETDSRSWKQHAHGAAQIVRLRGPVVYENEFEKNLATAQLGHIATEAVLDNRHCFLESASWDKTFDSLIQEGPFNDRNAHVIRLRRLFAFIPGIFSDVTNVVCSETPPNSSYLRLLYTRAHQIQLKCLKWKTDIDEAAYEFPASSPQSNLLQELNGTFLACILLLNRLMSAIAMEHLSELEQEVLEVASKLIAIDRSNYSGNAHLMLFLRQKRKLAVAANNTSSAWLAARPRVIRGHDSLGILPADVFRLWCDMLRRQLI